MASSGALPLDSNEKKFDFSRNSTIPETNGLHPKIEGSKMNIYIFGMAYFQVLCCFFRDFAPCLASAKKISGQFAARFCRT